MVVLILCLGAVGCLLYWLISQNAFDSPPKAVTQAGSFVKESVSTSLQCPIEGATVDHAVTKFLGRTHPVSKIPYPVMTTDMVTGVDGQLSYEDCKKTIRLYLKAIDFQSDRGRAGDIESIHGWMVQYEDFPRKCANELHEGVAVHRTQLTLLKEKIKICKDKNLRNSLKEEIQSVCFEIASALDEIDGIKEEIQQLKVDRLCYLIDNINRHVHGEHWRIVCNRPAWYGPTPRAVQREALPKTN